MWKKAEVSQFISNNYQLENKTLLQHSSSGIIVIVLKTTQILKSNKKYKTLCMYGRKKECLL